MAEEQAQKPFNLEEMSDEEIREIKGFYYEVELRDGVFTSGRRFLNMVPTRSLMQNVRFKGLDVLDVGVMEGALTVSMARAGANVTAYDRANKKRQIDLVKHAYNCDFAYEAGDTFHTYAKKKHAAGENDFDAILCSGVLYHTIDPLLWLHYLATMMKQGGILILESAMSVESDACMYFNEKGRFFKATNYYQVSTGWIDYALRTLGFRIVDAAYIQRGKYDKTIARVAVTCVKEREPVLESDDEWGAKGFILDELLEYMPEGPNESTDLSGHLINPLNHKEFLRSGLNSINLTKFLENTESMSRRLGPECVLKFEDVNSNRWVGDA